MTNIISLMGNLPPNYNLKEGNGTGQLFHFCKEPLWICFIISVITRKTRKATLMLLSIGWFF